ncbi:MAG: hypothetical protein ABIR19_02920, partial [Ginsengibacter sp.]
MLLEGALVLDHHKDTLLYAGTAKVNITDWFFIKDSITLKYIGLDNAIINLNRQDSVWNYQFLMDYFAAPKSAKKSSGSIALKLDVVEMNNLKVLQKDGWKGEDFTVSLSRLDLQAEVFDLDKSIFNIRSINIDHPKFAQYDYTGNRPEDTSRVVVKKTTFETGKLKWNPDEIKLFIKTLNITNGTVVSERQTARSPYLDHFDEKHIGFRDINSRVKNLRLFKDTIRAEIQLSAKERNGFNLKKLVADFRFTPEMMEFKKLDVITDKSHLGNYFAMHYQGFQKAMQDFIHLVTVDGHFANATVSSDDIAYLAPGTKTWNTLFTLNGTGHGTIDNFYVKNMNIRAGGNNYLKGDL